MINIRVNGYQDLTNQITKTDEQYFAYGGRSSNDSEQDEATKSSYLKAFLRSSRASGRIR